MKIAVAQIAATAGDVAGNLARVEAALAGAAAQGAALMVAPELVVPGYGAGEGMAALADPPGGPQARALADMAARHGVALVAGFAEAAEGALFNSALFTDGARQVIYRKSHLYGDYERGLFRPGGLEPVTFDHGALRFGMLICYDVEFPENVRRLAQAGVDAVLVPTALPLGGPSAFVAGTMIPVRAFENQIFVVYADLCGHDGRFAYPGLSHIAAPDGASLARAGEAPALILAEVIPPDYAAARQVNPYLADLRQP